MPKDENRYRFGTTTVAKITNSGQLRRLLDATLLKAETVVVKPNWISADPGEFTDAEALRILFEALGKRIVVVESYSLARSLNLLEGGKPFRAGEASADWKWLMRGAGWKWLLEHPDWEWFRSGGHWDHLREEENAFLAKFGFRDLFREFDVEYVNVTEEVWSGRTADPERIRQAVETRFRPVRCERLYGMVPQRLYELRGSPFVSFARLKMYASFTFKNIFGMIPDPLKAWWHGPDNDRIAASVVDINKVYHSLFAVFGICEAFQTTAFLDPRGAHKGIFTGRYTVAGGGGVVALGRDLLSLDAILLNLSDPARRSIEEEAMRDPIEQAAVEFGAIDRKAVEDAASKVKSWMSPWEEQPELDRPA